MIFNEKWDLVLKDELEKDYFKKLGIFVKNEYKNRLYKIGDNKENNYE